jgi:large subunit ribosomal protein L17
VRHRVYGRILGRTKNERTTLFKGLVRSLILWEKIETTEAKAKAIKGLIDKLINQAKSPTTRRLISQFLVEKPIQEKLVKDIAPRLKNRTSGYVSITRLGKRLGDGGVLVQMRLLTEGDSKLPPGELGSKKDTTKAAKKDEVVKSEAKSETKVEKTEKAPKKAVEAKKGAVKNK